MKIFRFSGRALGICAAAGFLAGCGGSHASLGSPTSLVPSVAGFRAGPAAGKEQVLYSFSGGNDGGNAATGLAIDPSGNLYGTTVIGGNATCGTVFKLAPQPTPPWSETVLYNFGCFADGKSPHGGVNFDKHGNLDGTTVAGGSGGACASDGCGLVFQLTAPTENVLHSFTAGSDGFGPGGGVVFDRAGNIYGTTPDGGADYVGVIYEVSPSGTQWKERVIHTFTGGKDGAVGSLGSLLIDKSGNLYGVTEEGGAHSAGTVFKMSQTSKNHWKLTTLYAFKGTPDAGSPYGGLVANASGHLFGTTYYGGAKGLGSVYELTPSGKGRYRERVLYSFQGGSDGSSTTTTLVFGGSGDLYGTTSAGGASCDCGTIFKVNPTTGAEKVLHAFGGTGDGAYSYYGLTADKSGNFYGTTVAGGLFGQGTVFKFTP
ncbi:MAG: choice-of-anchor tandem repeat GloVer-containing protein [Candidatus Baltobacteraceae bacterium]